MLFIVNIQDAALGQILCKSVHEIWSYGTNKFLHLQPRKDLGKYVKVSQGHSSSNSFKAMVGCITGSNFV